MRLLLQILEGVRALLFGPRMPGQLVHAVTPQRPDACQPVRSPSAREWAGVLQRVRRRRAPHLWPPASPALTAEVGMASPVRVYILPPEEQRLALSRQLQQVDPW